jgi:predicted RND superfamily exporter protein
LDGQAGEKRIIQTLAKVLGRSEDDALVEDLAWSVATPLSESWRQARSIRQANGLIARLGIEVPATSSGVTSRGKRFLKALQGALWDQDAPAGIVAVADSGMTSSPKAVGTIVLQTNGFPVLHRGLSRSVESNQIKSMVFALLVIVLILSMMFRSLFSGLLAAVPTLFTLVVIYGGMGLMRVHLDIGTSMLASIILGVGVDYGVHLLAAWRPGPDGTMLSSVAHAADRTGPAIWTNAVMIFLGFFVLTLGEAKPLQNVGGLTSAAMLVAALATFLAIPVLARKKRYRSTPADLEENDSSDAVDEALRKPAPAKG